MGDELEQVLVGKTLADIIHALPFDHPIQKEIERLKAELEEARNAAFPTVDKTAKPSGKGCLVVDCGSYSLELSKEASVLIQDLEQQLAEARAEVERLENYITTWRMDYTNMELEQTKLTIATKALEMMCSNDTDSLWKAKEIGRTALERIKE